MPSMHEVLKKFGEERSRELFGNRPAEERAQLATSYASLRSLLDPTYRDGLRVNETPEEGAARSLYAGGYPRVEELLRTDEAKLLWPKVMQDTILEPTEPTMIGQDVLCDNIRIDGGGSSVEWMSTDGIVAHFIDEAEGTQDDSLSFTRAMQSTKIRKAMVQVGFTEEMLDDSQYDLMGLHLRACSNALRRLKEEWIWTTASANAYKVFNNDTTADSWKGQTSGINSVNARNNTFGHLDFIDLMVGPVVHGWTPDTVILHPLHFASFVRDPLLRDLVCCNWPGPVAPPSNSQASVNTYIPWGLNAYLSPFVPTNAKTRSASTDVVKADIFVLSRGEALLLITRTDPTVKEWADPRIDVLRTNVRERYGVATKHKGQGMAVAKGVSTDLNWFGLIQLTKSVS